MPWSMWKDRKRADHRSAAMLDARPQRGRTPIVRLAVLLAGIVLSVWPSVALATPRPRWHPGPPWAPLKPGAPEMHHISDLFWVMLVISGIVFIGVTAVLLISAVRFTAKPDSPEPGQVFGNQTIEIAWTIIPTIVLLVAFIFTAQSIHSINTPEKGNIMNINVIGHQWWWEFRYPPQPQFGITNVVVTANELHLPTGVPLHFHIGSHDVIHSFWTPQLQRQVDANPAIDNAVYLKLDRPGVFDGDCYEYCGEAHAWMKYEVIAQPPSQFKAWVNAQLKPASTPASASLAAHGKQVFLANTCVSCHAVTGTSAAGIVGPNLTHVGSRWAIAAGAAPLTMSDLMAWIKDPPSYKPGVNMPGYPFLNQRDLRSLAAYLMSLK